MKKIIVGLVIVATAALSLSADIYIKSNSHTDAMSMMGQNTPATDSVSELWISDNAIAMMGKDSRTIIDLSKNMFTMISLEKKSYVETPLPVDFAKLLPPEMAAMAGMIVMSAKVSPTGETHRVGQWNCQGLSLIHI